MLFGQPHFTHGHAREGFTYNPIRVQGRDIGRVDKRVQFNQFESDYIAFGAEPTGMIWRPSSSFIFDTANGLFALTKI